MMHRLQKLFLYLSFLAFGYKKVHISENYLDYLWLLLTLFSIKFYYIII